MIVVINQRVFNTLLLLLICAVPASGAELSVFAASSLSEALSKIARSYETKFPGDKVLLNFAGSQTLATQIEQGAPADLFISANRPVMERLQRQELVNSPQPLLGNQLVLAARADLQPRLTSIADLARPELLLAIGNRQVPIGFYTRQLFARLATDSAYGPTLVGKIKGNIVSEEGRVKAIVAKLLLGEVDAGIVYQSDLTPANSHKLTAIALPQKHNPLAIYLLAKVKKTETRVDDFITFLYDPWAQNSFAQHGFLCGAKQ